MKRIFATRKVKKISPISPKENVYQVIIPLSVTTEKQLNAIFQLFFKKKKAMQFQCLKVTIMIQRGLRN
jgi:hypothetical protein